MNDKPVSYLTALDLADMMQNYGESGFQYPFCMELKYVAVMLRQQQAKIDLLRMTQPNIDYEKELLKPTFVGRELTDEELSKVYEEVYINYAGKDFPVDLGRAILRKAQEK
jgi:hypothetical protein